MTTIEDTTSYKISVTNLDEEIVHFDTILERIQEMMPEDFKIYNAIVSIRDYIFRLQQMMHGCEVVEFCDDGGAEELS